MQYTMVEYFSGQGNVSKMFKQDPSHRVASFELKDSPAMDINSCSGLAYLVFVTARKIYQKYGPT